MFQRQSDYGSSYVSYSENAALEMCRLHFQSRVLGNCPCIDLSCDIRIYDVARPVSFGSARRQDVLHRKFRGA